MIWTSLSHFPSTLYWSSRSGSTPHTTPIDLPPSLFTCNCHWYGHAPPISVPNSWITDSLPTFLTVSLLRSSPSLCPAVCHLLTSFIFLMGIFSFFILLITNLLQYAIIDINGNAQMVVIINCLVLNQSSQSKTDIYSFLVDAWQLISFTICISLGDSIGEIRVLEFLVWVPNEGQNWVGTPWTLRWTITI